jgi:hypothetical protein
MTITWSIIELDCKPQEGGFTDVVITAHWSCVGQQDGFSADAYGTCSFAQPGNPFTPYPDLTQEQVLGWCWSSGVNKAETEFNVQMQLNNLINPPVITPPLPWAP